MNNLILIIDDDDLTRSIFLEFLELENFNTVCAENGLVGLQLAQECKPDLILCDINMPILNGFQVLKGLRDKIDTAKIPLIFLTANTSPNYRMRALQLGANDYLIKPIEFRQLIAAINKQFQLVPSR
ncbi:MAG TPA: response regulator [Waterburya sp.]|jgi:DNA-binding response OmpR family regulator